MENCDEACSQKTAHSVKCMVATITGVTALHLQERERKSIKIKITGR